MKTLIRTLVTVVMALAFAREAAATPFTFSGASNGGTGSATMNIDIVGTALTLTLNNTSPILLNNGTGPNAPGITGFGFNLSNNPLPALTSWTLVGQQYNGTSFSNVTIGSSASSLDWKMDTTFAGVGLDYLPHIKGMDGALFNPAAVHSTLLPGGSNSVFFTAATLTMNFGIAPILDISGNSPFVRFQNVGANGAGSLKLSGTTPPPQPPVVPEPGTLLLVGSGLVVAARRARRKKASARA